jgi:hypothetical protein
MLEHGEPMALSAILQQLHSKTKHFLYVVISTRSAHERLPDGRDAHLTVRSAAWWSHRLKDAGFHVYDREGDGETEVTFVLVPAPIGALDVRCKVLDGADDGYRWLAVTETRGARPGSPGHNLLAAVDGLKAVGIDCEFVRKANPLMPRRNYGGLICWSENFADLIASYRHQNKPVIVLERGHWEDRNDWTRVGVGSSYDEGLLWRPSAATRSHVKARGLDHIRKARNKRGRALVIGQSRFDPVAKMDTHKWARRRVEIATEQGWKTYIKHHPTDVRRAGGIDNLDHYGATVEARSGADIFADYDLVISLTSTFVVQAVAYRCAVIADHENNPLWGLAPNVIPRCGEEDPFLWPERALEALAWSEFSAEELRSGLPFRTMLDNGVIQWQSLWTVE